MHVHPAENKTEPEGESRNVSQLGSHIMASHTKTLNSEDNGEVQPRQSSRIAYQKKAPTLTEELSSQDPAPVDQPSESSELVPPKKIKVIEAKKVDGVFETGLEVIEHEVEMMTPEDSVAQEIQKMFAEGKITQQQCDELLARQIKHQKIFAFDTYDEFFTDYFSQRDLVAVEDMNRVHKLIKARNLYK